MMRLSDNAIRQEWEQATRLYRRASWRGSSLGKRIALALADKLEAQGVTDADIDRVLSTPSSDTARRA